MKTPQQKLTALRAELKTQNLTGFIIPRISEYQGEFVAAYAERLEWLTGFTGSSGVAIVMADRAVIMTDGRYTIQLAQQADRDLYALENSQRILPSRWLAENVKEGDVIGYDPWLLTQRQVETFEKSLADYGTDRGAAFVPVDSNPVDAVWKDRPAFPAEKAEIFPEEFSGVSAAEKIKQTCAALKQKNLEAAIITMPDSLAWLLNIRGGDVEYTPVVLAFGILHVNEKVEWFVDAAKITPEVKEHLGLNVKIIQPEKISEKVTALRGKKIGLDLSRSPAWFHQVLGDSAVDFKDPCIDLKAVKNKAEQEALRAAHIRDAAALVSFLHWLDVEAPKGKLKELGVVEKLEEFRRRDNAYRGPSFATISGWADNGAIVHYRADAKSNPAIKPPGLLLLDSGGQYNDGTTDITRTIAIGEPTAEMRERFTLVLKGHINVARAKFPETANGAQIDALARAPLWDAGLDYSHGTGHGVGCYLSVHEESASLSPRGTERLKPGMFLSNEPGYYKEGEYGIRIENLVLVRAEKTGADGQKMLGFETFSLVPIDRTLIKKDMLTQGELQWLNDYHAAVLKIVGPRLAPEAKAWLARQAAPL